uniref:Uncharacterized protein n=1 Tax=Rhizophora mucronata TaxID=61149 RepID=A0A2P2PY67_RHIMU
MESKTNESKLKSSRFGENGFHFPFPSFQMQLFVIFVRLRF